MLAMTSYRKCVFCFIWHETNPLLRIRAKFHELPPIIYEISHTLLRNPLFWGGHFGFMLIRCVIGNLKKCTPSRIQGIGLLKESAKFEGSTTWFQVLSSQVHLRYLRIHPCALLSAFRPSFTGNSRFIVLLRQAHCLQSLPVPPFCICHFEMKV